LRSSEPPLLGSTTPRIWTRPLVTGPPGPCGCGCALTPETSLGFDAVEFAEDPVGIRLLPWQRWLLIHALELRPDGTFRFRTVLVLVARQNGKTALFELKNLWKLFVLRVLLVLGTAQVLEYAEESWDKAVEIAESIPELAAEIAHVDKTNGKKTLRLKGGPRWKIATATRRGGRSLSADDVNLDELREHTNWDAWGAVSKTTMAKPNAQVWALSNAGDDRSVVLNDLQAIGRAVAQHPENDPTFGHFEWSAPDDITCTCGRPDGVHLPDCKLRDRAARAQANPALGYGTITDVALDSALATDPEAVYRTECLCQRVQTLADRWQVISEADYLRLLDEQSTAADPLVFSIDITPERSFTTFSAVGARPDGDLHGEVIDHAEGTSWAAARAVELNRRWKPARWVIDAGGAAGFLIPILEAEGLTVEPMTTRQVAQAFGMLKTAVELAAQQDRDAAGAPAPVEAPPPALDPAIVAALADLAEDEFTVPRLWIRPGRHTAALAAAVEGATPRRIGDGTTWDRRNNTIVISPIVSLTNAVHGFVTLPAPEPPAVPLVAWR